MSGPLRWPGVPFFGGNNRLGKRHLDCSVVVLPCVSNLRSSAGHLNFVTKIAQEVAWSGLRLLLAHQQARVAAPGPRPCRLCPLRPHDRVSPWQVAPVTWEDTGVGGAERREGEGRLPFSSTPAVPRQLHPVLRPQPCFPKARCFSSPLKNPVLSRALRPGFYWNKRHLLLWTAELENHLLSLLLSSESISVPGWSQRWSSGCRGGGKGPKLLCVWCKDANQNTLRSGRKEPVSKSHAGEDWRSDNRPVGHKGKGVALSSNGPRRVRVGGVGEWGQEGGRLQTGCC